MMSTLRSIDSTTPVLLAEDSVGRGYCAGHVPQQLMLKTFTPTGLAPHHFYISLQQFEMRDDIYIYNYNLLIIFYSTYFYSLKNHIH